MTRAHHPDLSVIIPAVNGLEILLECLDALRVNARSGLTLEVLVVERSGGDFGRHVAAKAPDAVLLSAPHDATIPQMRAMGFRHARAEAIAVIEDHILVPADWAQRLLAALSTGASVVGGGVHNAATSTTVDWAAFLCEYSHMLSVPAGGDVAWLTGNNVVYRRSLVERYSALLDAGRWEDHFHAALRREGIALMCIPDLSVGHKMHYRMIEYLSQRYFYSRAFAGARGAGVDPARRIFFTVRAVALPPVLLGRIIWRVLAARRHRAELVRALPLLVPFVCAWAAGEAVGYGLGPGDALGRVR